MSRILTSRCRRRRAGCLDTVEEVLLRRRRADGDLLFAAAGKRVHRRDEGGSSHPRQEPLSPVRLRKGGVQEPAVRRGELAGNP